MSHCSVCGNEDDLEDFDLYDTITPLCIYCRAIATYKQEPSMVLEFIRVLASRIKDLEDKQSED